MEKSKIILASGSPRRKELLLQIGIVPEIIVSHVEEKITSDVPAEVVMSLAEQKAVRLQRAVVGILIVNIAVYQHFHGEVIDAVMQKGSHVQLIHPGIAVRRAGRTVQHDPAVYVYAKDMPTGNTELCARRTGSQSQGGMGSRTGARLRAGLKRARHRSAGTKRAVPAGIILYVPRSYFLSGGTRNVPELCCQYSTRSGVCQGFQAL